jgi:hypothetical protein
MRTVALIGLLGAIGIAVYLWAGASIQAARPRETPILMNVGDSIRVSRVPLGCKVTSVKGIRALDCRIAGALAGSYGTIASGKRLLVVRFMSDHVAKVVFDAKQHGGSKRCR